MVRTVSSRFVWVLLFLALCAVSFELGRSDVVSDNEGQRATPPAEMLRNNQYLIPTINGKDYLAKPPLLYWAIAGVYRLTGEISPLTARIPSALCFVALVVLVYAYARRQGGEAAARWSALALLAAPYALQRARVAELDIPLTLAITAMVMAYRGACRERASARRAWLTAIAGVALAAAMMLKGPVPFLFLYPAFLAHLLVNEEEDPVWLDPAIRWTLRALGIGLVIWVACLLPPVARVVRFPVALALLVGIWTVLAWRHGVGRRGRALGILVVVTLIGVAVASPWGVMVIRQRGWDYVVNLLQSESLERTHTATSINSGSPLYYLLALPFMLFPWGFLLYFQWSRALWAKANESYRFNVLTAWVSVFLFSLIAGKEYEYVLPAVPFLLMGVGWHLAQAWEGLDSENLARWVRSWERIVVPLMAFGAVGLFAYILVKQRHPALVIESAALTILALWAFRETRRQGARRTAAVAVISLCVVLMGLLSQSFYYTGKQSYQGLATLTANLLRAGYTVEAVKMTAAFDVYPGFAYYAGMNVPAITDPERVRERMGGALPYFCIVRDKQLADAGIEDPEAVGLTVIGPYRKGVMLIGNMPVSSETLSVSCLP